VNAAAVERAWRRAARYVVLTMASGVSAGSLHGADWRDSLTSPQPGSFPPLAPLTATYRFGWGALSAARADFDFARTPRGELRLTVTTATTGAVRALWCLDAKHEALCRPASLAPLSLVQTETYRDESHRTRVTFDAAGVSRLRESKPTEGKPAKTRRFKCPHVFDLQTALLFVRSQPLRRGDVHRFVVYPATDAYLASVRVLGREKVQTAARSGDAIKLDVQLQAIDKKLALVPHKKFKRATAWLSDDRDRLLLKVSAEISVGSVWVELERVRFSARR
jgi:hypothetical protein